MRAEARRLARAVRLASAIAVGGGPGTAGVGDGSGGDGVGGEGGRVAGWEVWGVRRAAQVGGRGREGRVGVGGVVYWRQGRV